MSYSIDEGIDHAGRVVAARKAIAARYPHARQGQLPGGLTVWLTESDADVTPNSIEVVASVLFDERTGTRRAEACFALSEDGDGGRVYRYARHRPSVVLREMREQDPALYAALVAFVAKRR